MAEHWIEASEALKIAGSKISLCTRLHAGLIEARARTLSTGGKDAHQVIVPSSFWWAKGHQALEQDWVSGDFSTWIDKEIHVFAFGVMFPLSSVLEMVPFERRAVIARQLSVAGSPDWLPAFDARKLAETRHRHDPVTAGSAIIEHARLGFIGARAVLARGATNRDWTWDEREWDIPTWFWVDFTEADQSKQYWELGCFQGSGLAPDGTEWIELSGIHFYRPSLVEFDPTSGDAQVPETLRGRKPKYVWPDAINTCWGRIYRGEPPVNSQADVEKLLIAILRVGQDEPGESTVRPFASQIWAEYSKP